MPLLPQVSSHLVAVARRQRAQTQSLSFSVPRFASTGVSSSDSDSNSNDDAAAKRARSAKASESIFLELFGFATPGPISMILFVPAMTFGINGNVPLTDIAFSVAFPMYLAFLNRFRFNLNKADDTKVPEPLLRQGRGEWYSNFVTAFGVLSTLLPSIYCFAVPNAMAKPAIAYTYLSLTQHIWETLCRSPKVYVLIRLLIPLSFSTFRLLAVSKWVKTAISAYDMNVRASLGSHIGHMAGIALGGINAIMLSYSLFGMLIPRILPQYLDQSDFPSQKVKWVGQMIPVIE